MRKHASASLVAVPPALAARRRKRDKEGGIALIMVMGAIAVLTVMLAEFQDETSAEAASAIAERDGIQAEYMAKSAINLARLLIATEPTIRMAIAPLFAFLKKQPPQIPVWEFSDRILGVFNDEDANEEFRRNLHVDLSSGKNLGIKGGRFELAIVDEDAKVNINLGASNDIAHIRLAKEISGLIGFPQYNPLFEQRDSSGQFSDRLSTCGAIIDWSDMDESAFNCDTTQTTTASSSGVEDAWYQLLPKPYRRKNAPYDSLEELHMVRGINDDFWATFVDPDPNNPKKTADHGLGSGRDQREHGQRADAPRRRMRGSSYGGYLYGPQSGRALFDGRDDGARNHDGGAAVRITVGLRQHDARERSARSHARRDWYEARQIPERERVHEEHHHGEQSVLDQRNWREKRVSARDARGRHGGRRFSRGALHHRVGERIEHRARRAVRGSFSIGHDGHRQRPKSRREWDRGRAPTKHRRPSHLLQGGVTMPILLGIDVGSTAVKAVAVRSYYKRTEIAGVASVDLAPGPDGSGRDQGCGCGRARS